MVKEGLLFDQSLQKLNVLFKFSGMNLQRKIKTTKDVIKYRWLYIFNFLFVLSAIIASFYCIYLGIARGKYFVELTSVAPCTIFSILSMFKSFYHLINEDKVSKLIESLRKLEKDEKNREPSVEKNKIIAEDRKFLNRVINVLYVINCSMIVFDMMPLVLIAVKYQTTKEFVMLLPYMDVFSFIPYEIKYWPFAYFHQIWTECVVLLDMAAADYLFFTSCTYIRTQFRLLQHDIEILVSDDTSIVMSAEEFHAKFKELVTWHQDIIESSMTLETIYSTTNLLNFLSSSLVICLTGFNVTIVKMTTFDDIVAVLPFITFLFMGLMQVFFLCFFADMMMTASMDVSSAVYNCKWYLTTVSSGKDLVMVQTRAQKPCKLTAAGFGDVNLNAFMRVLSTAWSYFALLQTVYGGKEQT